MSPSVIPSTDVSSQNIKNTQTQNQEQNSENQEQNNETSFHKNVCKVINYKYFDFIYFFITSVIGIGIYFISSEGSPNPENKSLTSVISTPSNVSKIPDSVNKNSPTVAELNIIQSQLNNSNISPPITPLVTLLSSPSPSSH